jgi:hypothetical protein
MRPRRHYKFVRLGCYYNQPKFSQPNLANYSVCSGNPKHVDANLSKAYYHRTAANKPAAAAAKPKPNAYSSEAAALDVVDAEEVTVGVCDMVKERVALE